MSSPPQPTPLRLRCNACLSPLTDSSCVFTSCGHLFCLSRASSCTALRPSARGRCEQCGTLCDVIIPSNRASCYDRSISAALFHDVAEQLQQLLHVARFRATHHAILLQQVDRLRLSSSHNRALRTDVRSLTAQVHALRAENAQLTRQLADVTVKQQRRHARPVNPISTRDRPSPRSRRRAPSPPPPLPSPSPPPPRSPRRTSPTRRKSYASGALSLPRGDRKRVSHAAGSLFSAPAQPTRGRRAEGGRGLHGSWFDRDQSAVGRDAKRRRSAVWRSSSVWRSSEYGGGPGYKRQRGGRVAKRERR